MLASVRLLLGRRGGSVARGAVSRGLAGQAWRRATTAHRLTSGGVGCVGGGTAALQPSLNWSPINRILARGYADLPEHTAVTLPALSPTMDTGMIVSWEKSEGEELGEGDVLALIETDKATMDLITPSEGYLAKICVDAGVKDLPIGKTLAIIVEEESSISAFKDYQPQDSTAASPTEPPPSPSPPPPPSTPSSSSSSHPPPPPSTPSSPSPPPQPISSGAAGRIFASPYAKTIASERGASLEGVQGTGMGGRIVSKDVLSASPLDPVVVTQPLPPPPLPSSGFTDLDLSSMRKTIAKRLVQSKQSIPHYYLTTDVSMDSVMNVRRHLNEMAAGEFKLSVNDFIIRASALTMDRVPEVNSSWMDTFIRRYHSVDVSVAVATPNGLITPIVKNADSKGLRTINSDVLSLAERAREGRLLPEEYQGGTFTISNLGMYGVKHFTAVINPPQSCILAVGAAEKSMIVDEETVKGYRAAHVMTVTLSCDHRVVDGAVGAQWLSVFRSLLEDPNTMLL